MAAAQQTKKKCRQYSVEYLKYGFVSAPNNQQQPMCLLCERVFSNEAMKPSRLIEHLKKIHSDKADKNLAYFQSLRENLQKRENNGNMFASTLQQSSDGLRASYNISLLIARSGKPHTIGEELILPAVSEVLQTVLHKSPQQIIKAIPLSNNSIQRRVDEMAENIEDTLCNMLRTTEFGLQLDESTLPGNESLLLAYVRFVKVESLVQELLFARQLETDTKGESVFRVVENFFKEKDIPLTNIIACATDGAPSMTGHSGFISFLKKAVPGVFTVHMSDRFQDLFLLKVPDWVINPFLDVSNEETGMVEEELISLQNDIELRPKFKKSYQDFWLQKNVSDRYPALWNKVKMYFIAFPTSYLVERGFSAVAQVLSKQRNRQKITERGDLRLLLSAFQPDVEKLISLHQAHPSH